jgi:hypothetical protein
LPAPRVRHNPARSAHLIQEDSRVKKPFFASAVAAAMLVLLWGVPARAADENSGGIGFHVGSSPFAGIPVSPGPTAMPTLGIRQWFSKVAGIDVGFGFNVFESIQGTQQETWTGFVIDAGLPLVAREWQRVNLIFRPGVQLGRLRDEDKTVPPPLVTNWRFSGVSAELEVEWMLADRVSLSASQGLSWRTLKSDADTAPEQKFTSFGTTGSNFTELGFHVYLW